MTSWIPVEDHRASHRRAQQTRRRYVVAGFVPAIAAAAFVTFAPAAVGDDSPPAPDTAAVVMPAHTPSIVANVPQADVAFEVDVPGITLPPPPPPPVVHKRKVYQAQGFDDVSGEGCGGKHHNKG